MNFEPLRQVICQNNKDLLDSGLVTLTWGNVSGVDRDAGVMAIKPSGIDYASITPEDMVVLSLESGEVLEGNLKPSSDTPTHLYLLQQFPSLGGVVHTHSSYATAFAQAGHPIPALGTTHADHFYGEVPVVRHLTSAEIAANYEHHTGVAIVESFHIMKLDPDTVPAALVPGHGPFTWGATPQKALQNAIALEAVARMALSTLNLNPDAKLQQELLDKHFLRKHGPDRYYGQE